MRFIGQSPSVPRALALCAALASAPAWAQAPAPAPAAPAAAAEPKPKPWYEDLSLNAFVSAGFLYNLNQPSTKLSTLRVFDAPDNTFTIGVAELTVQKAVAAPSDVGFRVDLDFGGTIPPSTVSFGDLPGNFDLRQGFVSWVAPVGSGLRLDVGKFVTHNGSEVIEGWDNYNDNYSRSFLFNYAIPFTHTGAKVSYTLSPQVSLMAMVANGWDSVISRTRDKTVGGQIALTPVDPLSILLNYTGGVENIAPGQDQFRHLFDVVATLKVASLLTLGVNGDYGIERGTSRVTAGSDSKWYGAAGYLRVDAPAGYGLALRAEIFRDESGTRFAFPPGSPASFNSVKQTVYEGTATAFAKLGHLVLRGEFRLDASDNAIYTKSNGTLGKTQPTLALNTLVAY